jgi:hypothetical protein
MFIVIYAGAYGLPYGVGWRCADVWGWAGAKLSSSRERERERERESARASESERERESERETKSTNEWRGCLTSSGETDMQHATSRLICSLPLCAQLSICRCIIPLPFP